MEGHRRTVGYRRLIERCLHAKEALREESSALRVSLRERWDGSRTPAGSGGGSVKEETACSQAYHAATTTAAVTRLVFPDY